MKYIVLVMSLFLLPITAHAQTFVTKEQANTYFSSCIAQPSTQSFVGDGQKLMCACQAARMTQYFYAEDMKAMMSPDPAVARPAYNKMLINVYAPCMAEPTRTYHYNECISNPKVASMGDPQRICSCSASALAQHMQNHGGEIFEAILASDPNAQDPMSSLFADPGFQNLAQSKVMECLKR